MEEGITPANNKELHLRAVAEMAVMRVLLTCLCRQVPDRKELLAEFDQRVEELIHAGEVRTAEPDDRLAFFADLYRRSVVA